MREAGATAAQELAFTLADAIAYVEAALARGMAIDDFAPRLSFFFAAWSELFEEVAKFRAARRMWARIVRERFGSSNARSMACRFHVQTAGSSLTAQSVDNNVVRTTVQALAAILGGAQSLHTNSRDEALALPTEDSVRLALRTQQILAYESGVAETPDPLGGSYFVETLTDELEAAAQRLPRRDRRDGRHAARARGGLPAALDPGVGVPRPAGDRRGRAGRRRREPRSATRRRPRRRRSSGSIRRRSARQVEGVRRVRAERDPAAWEAAMRRLEDAARGTDNLLPPIIEAVKAYATVGEIANRLRAAWGVHRELITV